MKNYLLEFIGNDAGFGNKNNSAYIEFENKLFIIDCGYTVFNEIKNKFEFNKYDEINIIITHLHNDHAGSLSQLILYLWFVYKIKVNVISKCINIETYLKITGTVPEAYEVKTEFNNIQFIKTKHVDYLDAYGFIMNSSDRTILYTGDTATLSTFLPYLNDIDELYIDLSKSGGAHIKIDDILDELKKLKNNRN